MHKSITRRIAALAAVVIGAVVALAGAVSPANAVELDGPDDIKWYPRHLYVHLYETPEGELVAGNGLEIADVPAEWKPIEGVTFHMQRINVDLLTQAGWDTLNANAGDMTWVDANLVGSRIVFRSGADGTAHTTVSNPGTAHKVSMQFKDGAHTADPFVITMPMHHPETGKWMYEIHAYPKVSRTALAYSAAVFEPGDAGSTDAYRAQVSHKAAFNVKTAGNTNVALMWSGVPDGCGEALGVWENWGLINAYVTIDGVRSAPLDREELEWHLSYGSGPSGNTISFMPGNSTRTAWADRIAASSDAHFEIVYTPARLPEACQPADGVFQAKVGAQYLGLTAPDPTVVKWADLTVLKTDKDDTTPLADATFALYRTEADARADENRLVLTPAGATSLTTGSSGAITIPRLGLSNWVNGIEVTGDSLRDYWLGELVAPDGYVPLEDPVKVQLLAAGQTVTVPVENAKDVVPAPAFPLPLTGGAGTAAFGALGLLVLAGAFGARAVWTRRKEQ